MLLVDIARALLDILGSLLVGLLLLRTWATAIGMPARNPLAHFARALTDWLVRPLARVIPSRGRVEWAALLAALVATVIIVAVKVAVSGLSIAWDLVLIESVRQLLQWALTLIIWVTLIYVVISWVNPLAPVAPALVDVAATAARADPAHPAGHRRHRPVADGPADHRLLAADDHRPHRPLVRSVGCTSHPTMTLPHAGRPDVPHQGR